MRKRPRPEPAREPLQTRLASSRSAPTDGRYLTAYEVRPGVLRAFWRDGDDVFYRDDAVNPTVFLKRSELAARPGVERSLRESRHVASVRADGDYVRVEFRDVFACRKAAQKDKGYFATVGVEPFEADVGAIRRWSVDTRAGVQKPRRCYVDLETDSRLSMAQKLDMRILCWSLVDDEGRRYGRLLEADTDAAERVLLEELLEVISGYDQVLAWNGDGFDFPVLKSRFMKQHVRVEWGRFLLLDQLRLYAKMIASQAQETGEGKQSLKLEDVSKYLGRKEAARLRELGDKGKLTPELEAEIRRRVRVLGAGKMKGESGESLGAQSWQMWEAGGARRQKLLDYCVDDTVLLAEIERVTGHCELFHSVCDACGVFPDSYGTYPTQYVESFLMRLAAERGIRFRTLYRDPNAEKGKREKFKGAFVQEVRKEGALENVHVCDFKALYPSIILTWNMSPETYRPDVQLKEDARARPSYLSHLPLKELPLPEGHCVANKTGAVFVNEPRGILCVALETTLELRKKWSALKASTAPGTYEHDDADRRATSYKVINNSFYGVISSPWSRFSDKRVGEAITQQGVWLIQEAVMQPALERGYRIVAGDTDSSFVAGCTREEMAEFVRWVNEVRIPEMVRSKGCSRSHVKLEHEKGYAVLVLAAKKKYLGKYSYFGGTDADANSKPEIKGFEYKRGDAVALARKLQERVAYAILGHRRERERDPAAFHRIAYAHRAAMRTEAYPVELVQRVVRLDKRVTESHTDKAPRPKQPKLAKAVGDWITLHKRGHDKINGRPAPGGALIVQGYLEKVEREFVHVRKGDGELVTANLADGEIWIYKAETYHVRVARTLFHRGRETRKGTKVAYYFGPGGEPKPAEDFAADFDRAYLWEHLVWPPTERMLAAAFPAVDWSRYRKLYDESAAAAPAQQELFSASR